MIRFEQVTPDSFEEVIGLKVREDQTGSMLYYFLPFGVQRQMGPGEGVYA